MVTYTKEEKQAIVEAYKISGKSIKAYAEENNMKESTLQGWLKAEKDLTFGAIEVNAGVPILPRTIKPATIFATDNMRIGLKEGFDKELLKSIVEVLPHK